MSNTPPNKLSEVVSPAPTHPPTTPNTGVSATTAIVMTPDTLPGAVTEGHTVQRVQTDPTPRYPYTPLAALVRGDVWTKLSALIMGVGNARRGQVAKGLMFLAMEILYIAYMALYGGKALSELPRLGSRTLQAEKIDGYWHYTPGDNSVLLLIAGMFAVFITGLFVVGWLVNLSSAYKAEVLADTTGSVPSFADDVRSLADAKIAGSLMLLPTLGILLFTVLPTAIMMLIAFTSYDSGHVLLFDWVGLENFRQLFSGGGKISAGQFFSVLSWTLIWAVLATFLNFFLGMFLAMIILRKTVRLKNFWRGVFSLSVAVPQFVSLLVINQMLQPEGVVNRMLINAGWISDPLPFFTEVSWARATVVIVNLWIGIPFTIMQITGILQNIPAEQYEAARIDGAGWWKSYRYITMPYLLFVLTPYLITTFTGNVNNFNVIYLLSGGSPTPVGDTAGKTDLLITWLYKLTVDQGDYNVGAVIGIFTFITLAVVSLITYRASASYKEEGTFK